MPNPEWGVKRLCPSCSTRFYDLAHDPATCPSCGGVFSLDSLTLKRGRAERADAKMAASAARARSEDIEDDEILETEEAIDVGDEILEEDEDEDTVPLEDIAERPGEEPET